MKCKWFVYNCCACKTFSVELMSVCVPFCALPQPVVSNENVICLVLIRINRSPIIRKGKQTATLHSNAMNVKNSQCIELPRRLCFVRSFFLTNCIFSCNIILLSLFMTVVNTRKKMKSMLKQTCDNTISDF